MDSDGGMEIRLHHLCPRKLALAGRPAGLAVSAMWYLGKGEVTPSVIGKIHCKLSSEEFSALKSATSLMPGWMSQAMSQYRKMAVPSHA